MANTSKDTIYIDIDDEITGIIDKVQGSSKQIVALVLPKRATVLQSVVNMRLLKRATESSKKHLVLITSEAGLLPLAGAAGIHVAKTLQSKPVIPPGPETPLPPEGADTEDVDLDSSAPVGELAGLPAEADDEAIEIDNDSGDDAAASDGKKKKSKKTKKEGFNKKLKGPNFEKFRVCIFAGVGGLIALIILWFNLNSVLPKATITIKTDTSTANSDVTLTVSPNANTLDKDKQIVPATKKEYKKTDTEKIATSGTKDKGTKATGNVTFSTSCGPTVPTIPSGTTIGSNGLNFITQADVSLSTTSVSGGHCTFNGTTAVTAQNAGDQYNLSARSYNVSGYSSISAQGTAMSGGTSNIVRIVTQTDIDAAKQKILDRDGPLANDELKKQIQKDGKFPIVDTATAGAPAITSTPNVGDEAGEVTVNATTTFTMYAVKEDDLKQLVDADVKGKIDTSKQGISDYGLDKATFKVLDKPANGDIRIEMQSTVTVGLRPDVDAIRKAVAGKKKGDTQATISAMPGVKEVNVKYGPFWVYKTPKKQSRITVNFEKIDDNNQ